MEGEKKHLGRSAKEQQYCNLLFAKLDIKTEIDITIIIQEQRRIFEC